MLMLYYKRMLRTMKNENIRNYKKIKKYGEKLNKLEPYVKNKEIFNFIREDFEEMEMIQTKLKNKGLLLNAFMEKEITNVKILPSQNVYVDIINVYRVIENELETWRNIFLELK